MLFTAVPFLARCERAARAGFAAVEHAVAVRAPGTLAGDVHPLEQWSVPSLSA